MLLKCFRPKVGDDDFASSDSGSDVSSFRSKRRLRKKTRSAATGTVWSTSQLPAKPASCPDVEMARCR